MTRSDFVIFSINKFTVEEITATGAKLEDVSAALMHALNNFRVAMNLPIHLIVGGMTTGKHKSKEHKQGKAVDFYFSDDKKLPTLSEIIIKAVQSGFRGIGIYHNSVAYSFHLDIGEETRTWAAWKKTDYKDWVYTNLVEDPKQFTKGGVS